jgi:hypothetical protein
VDNWIAIKWLDDDLKRLHLKGDIEPLSRLLVGIFNIDSTLFAYDKLEGLKGPRSGTVIS